MKPRVTARLAEPGDAKALRDMNAAFNGPGLADEAAIALSIITNKTELTGIAEVNSAPVGFCCVQIKRSLCYNEASAEITELFVAEKYRRMGAGTALLEFMLDYVSKNLGVTECALLTGAENLAARRFYEKMGFAIDDEVRYVRNIDT